MEKIQEQFRANPGGCFRLEPGEYEGPLVIDRSCVVDGRGATLWSARGPVLLVRADNVTVKGLRVEVTGQAEDEGRAAIRAEGGNVTLEGVEVRGDVIGLPGEAEVWELPGMISLGEFAAGEENVFTVSLPAPGAAELACQVRDLRISPSRLEAGENTLTLTTGKLRDNTILYGSIMVCTTVTRRVCVTGKALREAPVHRRACPAGKGPRVSLPVQVEPPEEVIAPRVAEGTVRCARRGERISVRSLCPQPLKPLKLLYEHQSASREMDVDAYCFALGADGKVSRDEDLVFFGNPESADHAIRAGASEGRPMAVVDLDKVSADVSRIAVCYAVYGDEAGVNFSLAAAPAVRVFAGDREVLRFELDALADEKTVVAAELYRYKGEWKVGIVGAGWRDGLRRLCENYGVDVM